MDLMGFDVGLAPNPQISPDTPITAYQAVGYNFILFERVCDTSHWFPSIYMTRNEPRTITSKLSTNHSHNIVYYTAASTKQYLLILTPLNPPPNTSFKMPGTIIETRTPAVFPSKIKAGGVKKAPPKVVGPKTKRATRPTNLLPQWLIDGERGVKRVPWNPEKHLAYQPPRKIYSMKEIGLEGEGISPNAVSEPFQLFSEEAIRQMRAEAFSDYAVRERQYCSTFNKNMIRGLGHE